MSNTIKRTFKALKLFAYISFFHLKNLFFLLNGKNNLSLHGLHEIGQVFSQEEASHLVEHLERLRKDVKVRNQFDGHDFYDVNFTDICKVENKVPMELLKVDQLTEEVAKQLESKKVEFIGCHFYYTHSETSPRCYHVDSFHQAQYKAFTYLNDIAIENGPYCYVKGSHRMYFLKIRNVFNNLINNYPLTDMRLVPFHSEHLLLYPAGATFLTDQRGTHKGHPQKNGHIRYVLVHNFVVS